MVFFRVCDTLPDHPKVMAAGNAAMGLWVRSGAWFSDKLTDGFVPLATARMYGVRREINALVDSGLWIPRGSGFVFHDWQDYNDSKAEIEDRRARDRARKRRTSAAGPRPQSGQIPPGTPPETDERPSGFPVRSGSVIKALSPSAFLGLEGRITPHRFVPDVGGCCAECSLPEHNRHHVRGGALLNTD